MPKVNLRLAAVLATAVSARATALASTEPSSPARATKRSA
jgi:hypothetical protein